MAGMIRDINNPVVFFDITIGGYPSGRIKMELFADVCPKVLTFSKSSSYS